MATLLWCADTAKIGTVSILVWLFVVSFCSLPYVHFQSIWVQPMRLVHAGWLSVWTHRCLWVGQTIKWWYSNKILKVQFPVELSELDYDSLNKYHLTNAMMNGIECISVPMSLEAGYVEEESKIDTTNVWSTEHHCRRWPFRKLSNGFQVQFECIISIDTSDNTHLTYHQKTCCKVVSDTDTGIDYARTYLWTVICPFSLSHRMCEASVRQQNNKLLKCVPNGHLLLSTQKWREPKLIYIDRLNTAKRPSEEGLLRFE